MNTELLSNGIFSEVILANFDPVNTVGIVDQSQPYSKEQFINKLNKRAVWDGYLPYQKNGVWKGAGDSIRMQDAYNQYKDDPQVAALIKRNQDAYNAVGQSGDQDAYYRALNNGELKYTVPNPAPIVAETKPEAPANTTQNPTDNTTAAIEKAKAEIANQEAEARAKQQYANLTEPNTPQMTYESGSDAAKQLQSDIWNGKYGVGQARVDALAKAGYSADQIKQIQSDINNSARGQEQIAQRTANQPVVAAGNSDTTVNSTVQNNIGSEVLAKLNSTNDVSDMRETIRNINANSSKTEPNGEFPATGGPANVQQPATIKSNTYGDNSYMYRYATGLNNDGSYKYDYRFTNNPALAGQTYDSRNAMKSAVGNSSNIGTGRLRKTDEARFNNAYGQAQKQSAQPLNNSEVTPIDELASWLNKGEWR